MESHDLKIDWENLRHNKELESLLNPRRPAGAEFARNAEKALFTFMHKLKIWKVYIWDDFHTEGSTSRWDWCFDYKRPDGKACREQSFANLVAMDDRQFERLVRSLPKSPNEDIVREWRDELRNDPLIVNAAKAEANTVDRCDLEYDPEIYKKELI